VDDVSNCINCITLYVSRGRNFACGNSSASSLNQKIMKNTTELKGNWNELKGKLKQKFAMLTEDDLLLEGGRQDELLGRLQVKLGKTKEEVQKLIADL
jgi:uncharacterized protein YjbJ (UPF0337 family)